MTIALAMNNHAGEWDRELLIDALTELTEIPEFDVELTGFDVAEVEDLLADLALTLWPWPLPGRGVGRRFAGPPVNHKPPRIPRRRGKLPDPNPLHKHPPKVARRERERLVVSPCPRWAWLLPGTPSRAPVSA